MSHTETETHTHSQTHHTGLTRHYLHLSIIVDIHHKGLTLNLTHLHRTQQHRYTEPCRTSLAHANVHAAGTRVHGTRVHGARSTMSCEPATCALSFPHLYGPPSQWVACCCVQYVQKAHGCAQHNLQQTVPARRVRTHANIQTMAHRMQPCQPRSADDSALHGHMCG